VLVGEKIGGLQEAFDRGYARLWLSACINAMKGTWLGRLNERDLVIAFIRRDNGSTIK
jgi:hypothetical protein